VNIIVANLLQYDNETFDEAPQWTDDDTGEGVVFTGSTFTMDIKVSRDDVAPAASATLDVTDIADGIIGIQVAMGALDVGVYEYDLVRTNGSVRSVIMTGTYTVAKGVTQLV
jgi:hypothetical protein